MERISHIFWSQSPHLVQSIAPAMMSLFPGSKIYLWERSSMEKWDTYEVKCKMNEAIIQKMGSHFGGHLKMSLWRRYCGFSYRILRKFGALGGLVYRLADIVLPEISVLSLCRLISGPRCILNHGAPFSTATMCILKFFGKHVCVIHWGGLPALSNGSKCDRVRLRTWHLHDNVYVLMSPEKHYFEPYGIKVSVLPYSIGLRNEGVQAKVENCKIRQGSRTIILGNNAHLIDAYPNVLDKLDPGDWEEIICMLNYGNDEFHEKKKEFVERYSRRFGKAFNPWLTTVPLAEYMEKVSKAAIYVCPWPYQSGLGAIANAIRDCKAIILTGDNYKWMRSNGVVVHKLENITDWSAKGLASLIPDAITASANFEAIKQYAGTKAATENWKKRILDGFAI